ncbi:TSUP family transporter [Streptomyces sp. NPDC004237]|uniref:TSUP family transporter n=1 Tax=Streptomyces sp. NPDC004237 TaxID=3154455 RepID=UPI0033BCE8BF
MSRGSALCCASWCRGGRLCGLLTRCLIAGALPGVVCGVVIRVFALLGPAVFGFLVVVLLLRLGLWLVARILRPALRRRAEPSSRAIAALAVTAGAIGGFCGIGGGSVLGPVLAGGGMPVAQDGAAALVSAFLAALVGAGACALLSLTGGDDIASGWVLGLALRTRLSDRRLSRRPPPAPPARRLPLNAPGLPRGHRRRALHRLGPRLNLETVTQVRRGRARVVVSVIVTTRIEG